LWNSFKSTGISSFLKICAESIWSWDFFGFVGGGGSLGVTVLCKLFT
jgi:hypothetical protein